MKQEDVLMDNKHFPTTGIKQNKHLYFATIPTCGIANIPEKIDFGSYFIFSCTELG